MKLKTTILQKKKSKPYETDSSTTIIIDPEYIYIYIYISIFLKLNFLQYHKPRNVTKISEIKRYQSSTRPCKEKKTSTRSLEEEISSFLRRKQPQRDQNRGLFWRKRDLRKEKKKKKKNLWNDEGEAERERRKGRMAFDLMTKLVLRRRMYLLFVSTQRNILAP